MKEWRTSIIHYTHSSLTLILLDCSLILKSDWKYHSSLKLSTLIERIPGCKAFNYVPTLITDSKTWILILSGFKVWSFLNHFHFSKNLLFFFVRKYFVGVVVFYILGISGRLELCKVWHFLILASHYYIKAKGNSNWDVGGKMALFLISVM